METLTRKGMGNFGPDSLEEGGVGGYFQLMCDGDDDDDVTMDAGGDARPADMITPTNNRNNLQLNPGDNSNFNQYQNNKI